MAFPLSPISVVIGSLYKKPINLTIRPAAASIVACFKKELFLFFSAIRTPQINTRLYHRPLKLSCRKAKADIKTNINTAALNMPRLYGYVRPPFKSQPLLYIIRICA